MLNLAKWIGFRGRLANQLPFWSKIGHQQYPDLSYSGAEVQADRHTEVAESLTAFESQLYLRPGERAHVRSYSNSPMGPPMLNCQFSGKMMILRTNSRCMIYQGKNAVVTGSTSGLGAAIVHKLAKEGAAGLLVTGRNQDRGHTVVEQLRQQGCQAQFVRADLQDPTACRQIFDVVDEIFGGRIHGLVNSAAYTDRGTIEETPLEEWDKHQAINVRAPFLLIQEAVRRMQKQGIGGSIVNIGSVSGYVGHPFLTPYASSKGGLMTLTKNVAHSQRQHHIRCNAVLPGWMDTPAEHDIQRRFHDSSPDWLRKAEAAQPFGRLIQPDSVAELVAYLLSDLSGVMTGAVINFDQHVVEAQSS